MKNKTKLILIIGMVVFILLLTIYPKAKTSLEFQKNGIPIANLDCKSNLFQLKTDFQGKIVLDSSTITEDEMSIFLNLKKGKYLILNAYMTVSPGVHTIYNFNKGGLTKTTIKSWGIFYISESEFITPFTTQNKDKI